MSLILKGLEVDLTDHNFARTPERYAKFLEELYAPPDTSWPVFEEKYTDIVVMRGHVFWTLCPHHMIPVKLQATVAYLPGGNVIGASKLIRMIHDVNRYPMTQEKLTNEIARKVRALTELTSLGEAVLLCGEHGCFQMRGVKSHEASMVTYRFTGRFQEDGELQHRFMELAKL